MIEFGFTDILDVETRNLMDSEFCYNKKMTYDENCKKLNILAYDLIDGYETNFIITNFNQLKLNNNCLDIDIGFNDDITGYWTTQNIYVYLTPEGLTKLGNCKMLHNA